MRYTRLKTWKSLQGGRAIAAMLVVLFHLTGTIAAEKYFGINLFSSLFSFGDSGVEFFFVLSGFIIYYAHKNDISQPDRLKRFLVKRLIRIYPVYWIIFLAICLAFIITQISPEKIPANITILIKSLLLIPQDKAIVGGSGAPVVVVAWSLQYEMVFYLVFAAAIINKYFGIVIGLLCFSLYLFAAIFSVESFPLSFLAEDFIFLFVIGIITARLSACNPIEIENPIYYLIGGVTLFLLVASDVVTKNLIFENYHTLLYGLSSGVIIFGLVELEKRGNVFMGGKMFQLLGDASYVLYLIHYPIISILCKVMIAAGLKELGWTGAMLSFTFIFTVCLMASIVFHRIIEKPLLLKIKNLAGLGRLNQARF